jgi:2'-5' RNA ligase
MKFLGEIAEESIAGAKTALARAARPPGPTPPRAFRLELEGLGAFPPRGPARVVWAGCGAGAGALEALASAVEEAFVAEGFPKEARPFSPHLTLARVRDPVGGRKLARALASVPAEPFGSVAVSSLVLFRSELTGRGAEYAELERVALESPAAPQ